MWDASSVVRASLEGVRAAHQRADDGSLMLCRVV